MSPGPARHDLGRYRVVDPGWPSVPRGSPFHGEDWDSPSKSEAVRDALRGAKWYGPLAVLDAQAKRIVARVPDGRKRTQEAGCSSPCT